MDQVSSFCLKVDEEYQLIFRRLPEIKRRSGRKPAQKFFTDFLSQRMTEAYGEALDPIVATLEEVAFDVVEGVGAETIRGRRRMRGKPENSRQKNEVKFPRSTEEVRLASSCRADTWRVSGQEVGTWLPSTPQPIPTGRACFHVLKPWRF
jgi:hypothetical protein